MIWVGTAKRLVKRKNPGINGEDEDLATLNFLGQYKLAWNEDVKLKQKET